MTPKADLIIKTLAAVGFVIALLWGRALYLQTGHFKAAEGYYAKSDYKLAIREYDSAMHFYSPLSPLTEKAAGRLWAIGEAFEGKGEFDRANIAYASIRSSFYAVGSIYSPGKDWIKKCDEKIASLNVKILLEEGALSEENAGGELKRQLDLLKPDGRPNAPDVMWSAVVVVSLLGWAASALFIIVRGFGPGGASGESREKLRGRSVYYGILSVALSFALWIAALIKA